MSEQLKVQGMTCGHCAHAVTEELGALEGVTSVSVDLVPDGVSTVTVEAAGPLDQNAVRAALSEAGDYHLV
ncbi:MAG: heavy-metal-associated domain-containing protein [Candidatus Nanopelagicales bacterium]|jgi:copper chaperone|nr:heavy-metal-associated domain-containing protein [Actinomycetota bacterium]HRY10949.1 heavy-metal-associated domain-containing protein [Candidatus Nanopelagicales bacterium]MCB8998366.1 heavy-metal-associated domain-containing protein [Actinomycetota bacterium]HNE88473.1 heavy-metal-associated domain-containing protein [Actinomycetota bacterium]HNL51342.1 heavy-metal-associated domain-containing protein [Actinomycetota bacterium]